MADFLGGVIEGFYGAPWAQAERLELFDQMAAWGLNTYMYGPKDDLNHRALWRECYGQSDAQTLAELIQACQQRSIRFIYALSPGLNVRYSDPSEMACLQQRFEQLLNLGCQHFALLFDDIPDQVHPEDNARWGSLAAAQCHLTNTLWTWLRRHQPQTRLLFCPTPYCERMAQRGLGGPDYLGIIGQKLAPEIDVFWTGPEIISREIPVASIIRLGEKLRRPPIIWDNLHANDYDGRRFFCGPYAGRPPELRQAVRGLLSNPNNELPLNYVALRTLAAFIHNKGTWDPRRAYQAALREWLAEFTTLGQPVLLEDLRLLCDCYYLPHEEGPEAQALLTDLSALVQAGPAQCSDQANRFFQQSARLRALCTQLTELRRRSLFHALSRRLWDLREELELLEAYVRFRKQPPELDGRFSSDSHLMGTYRGGLVARLQRLLDPQADGTFRALGIER